MFSQCANTAGAEERAPVCVLLCLCSSSLRVNLFPQNIQLQTKGRSPECQRRCARRCEVFPYTFPQPVMWQMCCFFFPMLDPLRKSRRGELGSRSVYFKCTHCFGLLTFPPTLYSWGKCTPLCAASCPPDPAGPPHPLCGREGGTDRLCSGWSRCSAASLQSLALPLSECLRSKSYTGVKKCCLIIGGVLGRKRQGIETPLSDDTQQLGFYY